jgi:hypothetical protein
VFRNDARGGLFVGAAEPHVLVSRLARPDVRGAHATTGEQSSGWAFPPEAQPVAAWGKGEAELIAFMDALASSDKPARVKDADETAQLRPAWGAARAVDRPDEAPVDRPGRATARSCCLSRGRWRARPVASGTARRSQCDRGEHG